jgi:hypothetical protein
MECHRTREASSGSFITRAWRPTLASPFLHSYLLSFFATSAIVMERGDFSRGSCVGAPGEGDGAPSCHRRLNPDAISMSGYDQAQHAACWGVPMLLQGA